VFDLTFGRIGKAIVLAHVSASNLGKVFAYIIIILVSQKFLMGMG
jgi:hypothetical protein